MQTNILPYLKCREEPCEEADDEHVTKDIKELISDSKETYTTWLRGSECKLVSMKNEVRKKTDTDIHYFLQQTEISVYSKFCLINRIMTIYKMFRLAWHLRLCTCQCIHNR